MNAIWYRARAEMRARWRAWLGLALIVGVAAGAAIAAAAGARRTATAYPRFLRAQDAFHANTGGGAERDYAERFEAIRRLPEVEDSTVAVLLGAEVTLPAVRGRPERRLGAFEAFVAVDPDGRTLYETNRAKVLEGRMPDRTRADEIAVPFAFADRHDVRVGDSILAGVGFDPETFAPTLRERVRVVGIVASPGDFEPVGQPTFPVMYATPALLERHREIIPPLNPDTWGLGVHLRDGPRAAYAFKEKVEREFDIDVPFIEPVTRSGVQKTMRLYAAALWILSALIAIAAVAVFAQTMSRQMMLESADYATLRAFGFGRTQLAFLGMWRAAAASIVSGGVATGIAFLASPLTPIGAARVAEPDPGFAFDAVAIGLGVAATITVVLGLSAWPAFRAARAAAAAAVTGGTERPSLVVSAAARAVRSPAIVSGLRMALEPGRGRTAVPVRSTILAVAIGIAAVTGVAVVGQSLVHLIDTPALAGFTYDAIVLPAGDDESDEDNRGDPGAIEALPFVETTTEGTGLNINIDGIDSFLVAFTEGRPIGFATIDGRAPTSAVERGLPEIALGPATMRRLRASLGDTVEFTYPFHEEGEEEDRPATARARVVGTAAIPPLPWAATEPGEGAVMTIEAVRSVNPVDQGGCCFTKFREGTDLGVARTKLEEAGFQVFLRTKRADLGTLERIATLPVLLGGLFVLMAVAALVHVLVTGIRRRRRDLAILKTIGFVRRQVGSAVAWQASTIATLAVVVGIPAGIALGRWGWGLVADEFGVVPVSVVPIFVVALALPVALVFANVIAALPARAAARTQPALVLRAE